MITESKIYLEMSRDEIHGGGSWEFPKCVWSPEETKNERSWAYWRKIKDINKGDIIIHLRGKRPEASFVGYSTASGSGFVTEDRPPNPEEWGFANRFYRANLTDFVSFNDPVILDSVFETQNPKLMDYFYRNKELGDNKILLFYVVQAERLQCQNGAYLTDIDDELFNILFDDEATLITSGGSKPLVSVKTGTQIANVRTRIGQSSFAGEIKKLYSNECCFPGCCVADSQFLVASHIARWADNDGLRGELGNGLCFCLSHDKAFEVGIFSLDDQYNVLVHPKYENTNSQFLKKQIVEYSGKSIKLAEIRPLIDALQEHRKRHNFKKNSGNLV